MARTNGLGSTPTRQPNNLGKVGRQLWADILGQYEIEDAASLATLADACAATDRAEQCRQQIEKDGLMINTRQGAQRDHPLLRHETANRALASRLFVRLGLTPKQTNKTMGRPAGQLGAGVNWRQLDGRRP